MSAGLFAVAIVVLTFLAIRAFSARKFRFVDLEVAPRLLMSQLEHNFGMMTYCLFLIMFYLLANYYYGPLREALLAGC